VSGRSWNQSNFESLTSLAAALRADSRLDHLAAYCELREKGLRREAFAQLDAFLNEAASWDVPVQRLLAVRVLDTHWNAPQAHQFFADPLRTRFVERVLEEWRAANANDPIPARYLALLRNDRALLDEALRLNPKDDDVRAAIARLLLSFVDHATHHLVEGRFIGDENDASTALAEAAAILAGVENTSSIQGLNENLAALTALLSDWNEYRLAPEGAFPEWCRARNRNHPWWSIVYYAQ
jgi:hypothetical protein